MRWIRFQSEGTEPRLGVVVGEDVRVTDEHRSIIQLLTDGDLSEVGAVTAEHPVEVLPLSSVRPLAPITQPPSVRDFMVFEQHVDGVSRMRSGTPNIPDVWYRQPLFYFSNPAAVHGPQDDIRMPPGCAQFDFELEVAAVIGSGGGDMTLTEAESAIAGYLILNDWSARDLQFAEMRGPLGPCKGKDSAITVGPLFVTPDELADRRNGPSFDLAMSVWINDEPFGRDRLDHMAWSFAEMAAYASRGTRLVPGDVLGSGTCGGGCLAELWGREGRDSRPSLQIGDVVRMAVDELGETSSRVVTGSDLRQPLLARPSAS